MKSEHWKCATIIWVENKWLKICIFLWFLSFLFWMPKIQTGSVIINMKKSMKKCMSNKFFHVKIFAHIFCAHISLSRQKKKIQLDDSILMKFISYSSFVSRSSTECFSKCWKIDAQYKRIEWIKCSNEIRLRVYISWARIMILLLFVVYTISKSFEHMVVDVRHRQHFNSHFVSFRLMLMWITLTVSCTWDAFFEHWQHLAPWTIFERHRKQQRNDSREKRFNLEKEKKEERKERNKIDEESNKATW